MCIRDSLKGEDVASSVRDWLKEEIKKGPGSKNDLGKFYFSVSTGTLAPVSYTHLDVYKRQAHRFMQRGNLVIEQIAASIKAPQRPVAHHRIQRRFQPNPLGFGQFRR